jgi:bifunctional pyridoxal-dependent enzyme with beta-cystathionase and maltose regulon repressor activities
VDDARDACRTVLEKARVGLAPGHLFGPSGRSFLRMCILRETAGLRQALARMADALR